MAQRRRQIGRRRRRQGRQITIPLAVVAGFLPAIRTLHGQYKAWGWDGVMSDASRIFVGYDPTTGQFDFGRLRHGLFPVIIGVMAHIIIGRKLGLNRSLARAGIPFFRF